MDDCLFCKIANGEIESDILYEDEQCVAFRDIAPAAPVHILMIPKRHMASLKEADDEGLTGHLIHVAAKMAQDQGVADDGYRIVINTGENGGQTVSHLHVHLLGGRSLQWPPG